MSDKARSQAQGQFVGSSTVLVVDDLDVLRKMVRDFLESENIRVLEASNGAEAIHTALYYSGTIDVLLTDIEMPGMSGWEVANEISALKPQIQLVYMSAGATRKQWLQQCEKPPRTHFIQKPFRLEEFIAVLPEERYLAEKFGESYRSFAARVRRYV